MKSVNLIRNNYKGNIFYIKDHLFPYRKALVFQNMKRDVYVIKLFQRFKMLFHQAYRQN